MKHQRHLAGMVEDVCPCCGQKMPVVERLKVDLNTNTAACNGVVVHMTPQHIEILAILEQHYPTGIHYERIIAKVWANTDKLIDANKSVQVAMSRIRKQIRVLGWAVYTRRDEGYQLVKL